jgi:cytidine deaminase
VWDDMLAQAREAMTRAYAPYSKFHVGACVKTDEGYLYSGCNVENASYSMTIDAEANAIAQMAHAGGRRIAAVLVICYGDKPCSPCGACRQRIREFAADDVPICMCCVTDSGEVLQEVKSLGELMPMGFGPEFLDD